MMNKQIKDLLKNIILGTGRDSEMLNEILSNDKNNQKIEIITELLERLQQAALKEEKYELLNRILLILGIPPMSKTFFERVFGNAAFNDIDSIKKCVDKIRSVYMLEYGNFYYGYRKLRDADPQPVINKYFSTEDEREKIIEYYRRSRNIPAFETIEVGKRYCLGYLASKENKDINGYREILIKVLEKGIQEGVNGPQGLRKIAEDMGYENWNKIVIRSAIATQLGYYGGTGGTHLCLLPRDPIYGNTPLFLRFCKMPRMLAKNLILNI